MDQVGQPTRVLQKRRRRPGGDELGMIILSDLAENPVSLTVHDKDGDHVISAERGKNGKVWLTCQCADSHAEGWCRHRVDLLCFRYDAVRDSTAATRRAFEAVVSGTSVFDAGRDADRALKAFNECLRIFDQRRPANIAHGNLGRFTDLVSDLAASAGELEDAIGNLRRLLERA
jgi:hypothetical protein